MRKKLEAACLAVFMMTAILIVPVCTGDGGQGVSPQWGWTKATVDSNGDVGEYASIGVDSANGVHIAYYDTTNTQLKYAYKVLGGAWNVSFVDPAKNVGTYCSLAVDKNDGVHISYFDGKNNDLKYAYKPAGGKWNITTPDPGDALGNGPAGYTAIAVDQMLGVHIAYYYWMGGTYHELHYAYKAPGETTWTKARIDTKETGAYCAIAIDSFNSPHISYRDEKSKALKYAYLEGGTWVGIFADQSGNTGLYTSIALDKSNGIHISYLDMVGKDLMHAFKTYDGDTWTTEKAYSEGDVGWYSSIAVDNGYGIHISFYDFQYQFLKYVYKGLGGNWTMSMIDYPANVGPFTSIKLGKDNRIHIAYMDYSKLDLKYATGINPDVAEPALPVLASCGAIILIAVVFWKTRKREQDD